MNEAQLLYNLEARIAMCETFFQKLEERVDQCIAAIDSGSACQGLGHRYELPLPYARRLIHDGVRLERKCARCGYVDGAWEPSQFGLQMKAVS